VKRGDIVVIATKGAYTSKPRPALVCETGELDAVDGALREWLSL
jgi:hypothetical protein